MRLVELAFLLLLLSNLSGLAQSSIAAPSAVINTVAGNGTRGSTGDGGLATSAQLQIPEGIAVDAIGNLYIADDANHRVRKVTLDGIITTVAGGGTSGLGDGGPATSAQLNRPWSVALDAAGDLYIADTSNHRCHLQRLDIFAQVKQGIHAVVNQSN